MSDFNKVQQVLEGLIDGLVSAKQLNKIGLAAQRMIQKRTREGVNVEGQAFAPYSPAYARYKRQRGLPVDVVNLTFNDIDGMMRTMDQDVQLQQAGVTLFFRDPEKARLASFHHESGAGKSRVVRRFFDLSNPERERIGKLIEADLNVLIQDLTEGL